MILKIEIDTANAAFDHGAFLSELDSILREVALVVSMGGYGQNVTMDFPLRDTNGNTVGKLTHE